METVWEGVIQPGGSGVRTRNYTNRDAPGIQLRRGAEMGRFNMGSTVIVLLPPGAVSTFDHYESGDSVVMGQKLGRLC